MLAPSQNFLAIFDQVKKAITEAEDRGQVYLSSTDIAWHVLGEKGELGPRSLIGRVLHAMERDGRLDRFSERTWIIVKNKNRNKI
jgi:hypothetical protein